MILYNLTVRIEHDIEEEWLEYIRNQYVVSVMQTTLFLDFKIYRLLNEPDKEGLTYALQFFSPSLENIERYLSAFARRITEDHLIRFKNKHVAFNTILESVLSRDKSEFI